MGRSTRTAAPPDEYAEYTSPNGDLRSESIEPKRRIDKEKQWQYGSLAKNDNQQDFEPRRPCVPVSSRENKVLYQRWQREEKRDIEREMHKEAENVEYVSKARSEGGGDDNVDDHDHDRVKSEESLQSDGNCNKEPKSSAPLTPEENGAQRRGM